MSKQKDVSSYRRFLEGDEHALEELIEEYGDALVRFAYCLVKDSFVAEDIAQDAFATLIFKRRHFSSCDSFQAYLYKIVRNKCIDYLRSKKRTVPLGDLENVLVSATDAEKDVLAHERNERVYACLQRLPAQYQDVLYLYYFEDCRAEAVSKIIRKTKKQTYNLLARAKSALKELLEKEGIVYENE